MNENILNSPSNSRGGTSVLAANLALKTRISTVTSNVSSFKTNARTALINKGISSPDLPTNPTFAQILTSINKLNLRAIIFVSNVENFTLSVTPTSSIEKQEKIENLYVIYIKNDTTFSYTGSSTGLTSIVGTISTTSDQNIYVQSLNFKDQYYQKPYIELVNTIESPYLNGYYSFFFLKNGDRDNIYYILHYTGGIWVYKFNIPTKIISSISHLVPISYSYSIQFDVVNNIITFTYYDNGSKTTKIGILNSDYTNFTLFTFADNSYNYTMYGSSKNNFVYGITSTESGKARIFNTTSKTSSLVSYGSSIDNIYYPNLWNYDNFSIWNRTQINRCISFYCNNKYYNSYVEFPSYDGTPGSVKIFYSNFQTGTISEIWTLSVPSFAMNMNKQVFYLGKVIPFNSKDNPNYFLVQLYYHSYSNTNLLLDNNFYIIDLLNNRKIKEIPVNLYTNYTGNPSHGINILKDGYIYQWIIDNNNKYIYLFQSKII